MKKYLLMASIALFATQANATIAELVNSVKHQDIAAVQNMLKNGENVNATDKDGNTALHYAVAMDNAEMARVLLASGADMNIENAKGWSPLKIAKQKQVPHVTEVLQNAMLADKKAAAMAVAAENVPNLLQAAKQQPAKSEPVKPTVVAKAATATVSADEAAVYKRAIEEAKEAVVEAKQARSKAEAQNKELETELNKLRAQNRNLEQRLISQEKATKAAEEKALKVAKEAKEKAEKEAKAKAEQEAKVKAAKEAKEKAAREAKAKAEALKKAAQTKPSALNPKIYAGDEEIVYCLAFLGNGENQNMKRAAGFYAATSSISERRFNEIATQADMYYSTALADDLQKYNEACSRIITPADAFKQNMIIRSLNSSIGY